MTAIYKELSLKEFMAPVNGELISGNPDAVITGVSTDTRGIKKGELFIALTGDNFDGHKFLAEAVLKGAVCVVVDDEKKLPKDLPAGVIKVRDTLTALGDFAGFIRRSHDVKVVSITGSMGKTTTKEMTSCILEEGNETLKNQGNFNNLIGLPLTLLGLSGKHKRAVVEMGMNHFNEIRRLTRISDPDIGLITNVGPVHLEGVGDIHGVAKAKTEMIEEMHPDAKVILFGDDSVLMKEATRFNREFFTFGIGPQNDVRAEDINTSGKGVTYRLKYRNDSIPVALNVSGMHNLVNSLAAASATICLNEKFENITRGLIKFKGVKGRLVSVILSDDVLLLDDTYNSNPSSLKAALLVAKERACGKRPVIVGLGDMLELGDGAIEAHIEAGRLVANTGARFLFAIGAHARYMREGALEAGFPKERAIIVSSHHEMITGINDVVKSGDLILLKGSRMMGLEKVVQGLKDIRQKGGIL
ncbi:MAG: UDP-N-acetylmuramoyl-tripeptide--D-alanyl-D-alanine ligase [Deltaproteobacteria bacterium]|nr:UDP-N-acetylmuramoyl-tripeptide--D-alanyl-D-alanine ligase [Deltaproteobacteria bacterium]